MGILTSAGSMVLILFGFGVLIFIHELGHFLAAKWAGIRAEGFAVGMGPVVASWRKGIGTALGSTETKVIARTGKSAHDLSDAELEQHGIGETEYSLRWLPIGGFVKMLGQEDANPTAVSDDARSYTSCPVGKRMIVVSAGVVMNVILALLLFVVAFMVGVRFQAPVIGGVLASSPAGVTMPANAEALGIEEPGLLPGDVVLAIDGTPARTFADLQIASAMAAPGEPIAVSVARRGFAEPLEFSFTPEVSRQSGLLSVGVEPGRSSRLLGGADAKSVREFLDEVALAADGIRPGMGVVEVDGTPISTYEELVRIVNGSGGRTVTTTWSDFDERGVPAGGELEVALGTTPQYEQLIQLVPGGKSAVLDIGLLGLSPLFQFGRVLEGSPNQGTLRAGDVIIKAGSIAYPRWTQLTEVLKEHAKGELTLELLRDGQTVAVKARVDGKGKLGVSVAWYEGEAFTTAPVERVYVGPDEQGGESETAPTAAAALGLLPGTLIEGVDELPVATWPELRAALRTATAAVHASGGGASVDLHIVHPTPLRERATLAMALTADDVRRLHDLGWETVLAGAPFESIETTLSAGGNPWTAMVMGFRETHKMIMMTYLTIDRLFRGSVGVEQLHGPVGIIHLGSKILPRGFTYFIFFLGMISVNLAVINFLPLPIVDGGLFLFLIYEKLKGKPPSIRFQNAATMVGLFLIGTVFVVTFYNDIMRLL